MKKIKKITKAMIHKKEKRLKRKEFKSKLEDWKKAVILRDKNICQMCLRNLDGKNDKGNEIRKHPHHIISFTNVKRKYPHLLSDIMNGILLCGYCHKFAPDGPHQGGFEFTIWLEYHHPDVYYYLLEKMGLKLP